MVMFHDGDLVRLRKDGHVIPKGSLGILLDKRSHMQWRIGWFDTELSKIQNTRLITSESSLEVVSCVHARRSAMMAP